MFIMKISNVLDSIIFLRPILILCTKIHSDPLSYSNIKFKQYKYIQVFLFFIKSLTNKAICFYKEFNESLVRAFVNYNKFLNFSYYKG